MPTQDNPYTLRICKQLINERYKCDSTSFPCMGKEDCIFNGGKEKASDCNADCNADDYALGFDNAIELVCALKLLNNDKE